MKTQINYGYVPEPEITHDQYVFGAQSELPKDILQHDGQWDLYLPTYEPQFENFETYGCTCWGTQNAIEIILKRLFGGEYNYSERFNYIRTPIAPPGASPHAVAENFRKDGLIDHELLPMTETYEEFIASSSITPDLLNKGKDWLRKYVFTHEWVFTKGTLLEKQMKMIEALRYSPLCASVYAWEQNESGFYIKSGDDNHWTVIFGYELGKRCYCLDTYDQSIKSLEWDYDFGCAKRYHVRKALEGEYIEPYEQDARTGMDIIKKVIEFIKNLFKVPKHA
jgi:hypothetical protein